MQLALGVFLLIPTSAFTDVHKVHNTGMRPLTTFLSLHAVAFHQVSRQVGWEGVRKNRPNHTQIQVRHRFRATYPYRLIGV